MKIVAQFNQSERVHAETHSMFGLICPALPGHAASAMPCQSIQWHAMTYHGVAWYGMARQDRPRRRAGPRAVWPGPAPLRPPIALPSRPTQSAGLRRPSAGSSPEFARLVFYLLIYPPEWNGLLVNPSAFFLQILFYTTGLFEWLSKCFVEIIWRSSVPRQLSIAWLFFKSTDQIIKSWIGSSIIY